MIVFSVLMMIAVGAGLGSFACCMVRRMREMEAGRKVKERRSVCLKCGARINWRDNIPVWSWLRLRGKCRKCGEKFGVMEIVAELTGAAVGLVVGLMVVPELIRLEGWGFLWLVVMMLIGAGMLTGLGVLVMYDTLTSRMPTMVLWICVGLGLMMGAMNLRRPEGVFEMRLGRKCEYGAWMRGECGVRERRGYEAVVHVGSGADFGRGVMMLLLSAVVLAGPYLVIYKMLKEQAVGGGDYILALALALALGHPVLAFLNLFAANLLGSMVAVPLYLKKKLRRVPMAPFLVGGFVAVVAVGLWQPSMMAGLMEAFELWR